MALDEKDLEAIRLLMREELEKQVPKLVGEKITSLPFRTLLREEIRSELQPFQNEVRDKFDEVRSNFDALLKRDEDREHEYLSIRNQVETIEKKVA